MATVSQIDFAATVSKLQAYQKIHQENPTDAEKIFRAYLRSQNIDFIFQKYFVFPFPRIFDFYFPAQKIAIEIDGYSHHGRETKDENKDYWYGKQRGIRIVRITNEQVYSGEFKKIVESVYTERTPCADF